MKQTFALILLFVLTSLLVAMTPAGTVIRNQASVVLNGESYLSNEVGTVVKAICQPALSPNGSPDDPGHIVSAVPGETVYLPYTLTNAGNQTSLYDLAWALHSSATWIPEQVRFYSDNNNNARLDSGEPPLTSVQLDAEASRTLLLEIVLPDDQKGDTLLTPVASCESGERDENNFALVQIADGPALVLSKTATPSELKTGETVQFTLIAENQGTSLAEDDITITDRLDTASLEGLVYVPASANSDGQLEYFDGASWQTSEPPTVLGLRATLSNLAAADSFSLSFQMEVSEEAELGTRQNVGSLTGSGGPAQSSAEVTIKAYFEHHLGPVNNPRALPGGEASESDRQSVDMLVVGQPYCFEHSLENAGTAADRYVLRYEGQPEDVSVSLTNTLGEPLANPLELGAKETLRFNLCLRASQVVSAFSLELTAESLTTNTPNLTFDDVGASVSANSLQLIKKADKETAVDEGETLTYTLELVNNNAFDLNKLVIRDSLQDLIALGESENLETSFISASDNGQFDETKRELSWQINKLAQGESLSLQFTIKLPEDAPKGSVYSLSNSFSVSANELPSPLSSNRVSHSYPVISILVNKQVAQRVVSVGNKLDYTLQVSNPNDLAMKVRIVDMPARALSYASGSAVITRGNVTKQLEPSLIDGNLVWDLRPYEELTLAPQNTPGDTLSIRYNMIVKPGAGPKLNNSAQAFGNYASLGSNALSVASTEVAAEVEVRQDALQQPKATLIGRVFLDTNLNGKFDKETDLALPGARLVLANGWQALTDGAGRYSFRELSPGPSSLLLDPVSAPFKPRHNPPSMDESYRQRILLEGLTVIDFPLEAPTGLTDVSRRSVLNFGPLTIEKWQVPLPEGVRVILEIATTEPLPDLSITDSVLEGEPKVFTFELFEGETTLTYDLVNEQPLTDPNARWRYP